MSLMESGPVETGAMQARLMDAVRQPLKLDQIFDAARAGAGHPRERLITYQDDFHQYHAFEGTLTLIMSRELKKSVEVASAVALHLALKYPKKPVLLFNTFASAELLTSGFVNAMHLLRLKIPWTFQQYVKDAKPGDFDDSIELPSPDNLFVLDCPTSTLTPELLEAEIARVGAQIVLLNSLEFAAFSDYRKRAVAEGLLALRNRLNLSVFVFSHELRPISPHCGGRGALGLLSAFTDSVWPILNEWERKKWVKRFKNDDDYEYEIQKTK
ncbi:MAG: hypothetical protein Q8922_01425 [Bacteroidota bacterium]|nr:hypothetical protein [Bacteroidota bacterium]MDP4232112.1 hypothetical protein [Bacteroidota bacterium]MDP4241180.1 hypothetical protein [Bacteroidota bacterium]MDP4286572.1 hypothetical protein [Bacteroidota bacterium]